MWDTFTCIPNVPKYYAATATTIVGLNVITLPVTNWLLPILLSLCAIKSKSPPLLLCTMLHELLGPTPFNWTYRLVELGGIEPPSYLRFTGLTAIVVEPTRIELVLTTWIFSPELYQLSYDSCNGEQTTV